MPYEHLPSASPTKANQQSNRASAFPYSSAFPLPGQAFDGSGSGTDGEQDGRSSRQSQHHHHRRLHEALGNVAPPVPPPGARPSAQAMSRTGTASSSETTSRGRSSPDGDVRPASRTSRRRSPDIMSIRSVASSVRSAAAEDAERRRIQDGDRSSLAEMGVGPSAAAAVSSSSGRPRSPPLVIPHRKNTLSSLGGRSSISSSSDNHSMPRYPNVSTFSSAHSNDRHGSVASHRSSSRPENPSPAMSNNMSFFPRRSSAASTASRTPTSNPLRESVMSQAPVPSPYSSDFHFPRPTDPAEIDALFDELLPRIGTSSAAALGAARSLDVNKKWTLIYNDAFMRWKNAREKLTHRPVDAKSAPAVGTTRGGQAEHVSSPRIGTSSAVGDRSSMRPSWGKNESPEWYIARFMDGTITQQQVASLSVCLRTYELQCVLHGLSHRISF